MRRAGDGGDFRGSFRHDGVCCIPLRHGHCHTHMANGLSTSRLAVAALPPGGYGWVLLIFARPLGSLLAASLVGLSFLWIHLAM